MKTLILLLVLLLSMGCSTRDGNDDGYDVVSCRLSGDRIGSIKWNTNTGAAYILAGWNWCEIKESGLMPTYGRYKIIITEIENDWAAIRLNVVSGQVWSVQRGVWNDTPDTKEITGK